MKKIYLLLVVLMGFGSISGQVINFPDVNFKNRLVAAQANNTTAKNLQGNYFKIDANSNGQIEISEALQVSVLTLPLITPYISSFVGIEYFTSLTVLDAYINTATSADLSALVNLEELYFTSNFLTSINVNGLVNLKKFNCNGGQLSALNVSSLVSLEELDCGHNNITSLDLTGLSNLTVLSVGFNNLTSLNLSNQTNLIELACFSNNLTTLNLANQNLLQILKCEDNLLTSLPIGNLTNLTQLFCRNNQLVVMDVTNAPSLVNFSCSGNQITSLNVAGLSQLTSLSCKDNALTALDLTGLTSMITFDGSGNLLQSLDFSTATSLVGFNCKDNQLTSLITKNGKIETQSQFYNNPNLAYLCVEEEEVESFQVIVDGWGINCQVNSYCSFGPGGIFNTIEGNSKFDIGNNGCDATDITFPNLKFNITNGTQTGTLISNSSGNYLIPVQNGTHTITPIIESPSYFNISPTSASVTFPATTSPFTQNFCITPNGIHPDLEITIVPTIPARPGFDAHYKIIIKNKGNTQQSGSVTFTYNDAVLDYVSANPLATTQATGTMTWDFANLEPFETREISLTLNVNSPMETPAVIGGDVLNYTAAITSAATDEMPLDNTFSLPQIVVNSFDPNDKTCLEGTEITPNMIGKYVHYMIRFENTGTFLAENIVVKDMIDAAKFDVTSLVPLNASHDYITRITGNKVEFIFEGINLPFEDATNDGYIVFKIKTLPTLVLGDSFSNSASIYFDYNFPIVTDPAVTTFAVLGTQDFVFNNYLTVYPNPTNTILNITAKQSIELKSMEVYNMLGQLVLSVPNATGVSSVDVSNLTIGTYFLKVVSDKGTSNTKFIKN